MKIIIDFLDMVGVYTIFSNLFFRTEKFLGRTILVFHLISKEKLKSSRQEILARHKDSQIPII